MNKVQQRKSLNNKISSLESKKTLRQSKSSKIDNFKNLLNAIIDSIAGIHWWKDINGIYQGCNSAMVEALGLSSRNDIIGKTDYELPWASQANILIKHDKEVMSTGITQKGKEEIIETKQGDVRTFIVAKAALRDNNNNIIGTVGNSIDVTELKQTQKEGKFDLEKQRFYLGEPFDNEYLTRRELEVFRYILYGYTLKKIAILLKISLYTYSLTK